MTSRLIKTTALLFSTLGLLACQSDNGISADVAGPADIDVQLAPAFGNLVFESPLALIPEPGNSNRYYVVERGGRVFRVDSTNPDDTSRLLYLDISAHVDDTFEGGLLSVALHPAFTDNGKVFVSYTESPQAGSNAALNSVISVLTQDPANGLADIASEQRLLEHAQPQANHNGGHILFGPDSYLYIGFGDGGGGGDPQGNAQNSATLLGSLLRIDVNTASPYAIPADNPLQGTSARAEIFAYGLRNPWRFSFDRQTGDLWLADVGQNRLEEINLIQAGRNYGWNCFEGTEPYRPEACDQTTQTEPPVAEYTHNEGASVTGGYVYRGASIPALEGRYVFGDFGSGAIWQLRKTIDGDYRRELLINSGLAISSFAESHDGELFVLDFQGGRIYQLTGKQ